MLPGNRPRSNNVTAAFSVRGNEKEEVAIYRYVTEKSFDAFTWQALETKAKFIGQLMVGDNTVRRAKTSAARNSPIAEVKAILPPAIRRCSPWLRPTPSCTA